MKAITLEKTIQLIVLLFSVGLSLHLLLAVIWFRGVLSYYHLDMFSCVNYEDLLYNSIGLNVGLLPILFFGLFVILGIDFVSQYAGLVLKVLRSVSFLKWIFHSKIKRWFVGVFLILLIVGIFIQVYWGSQQKGLSATSLLLVLIAILRVFDKVKPFGNSVKYVPYMMIPLLLFMLQDQSIKQFKSKNHTNLSRVSFVYSRTSYHHQQLIYRGYKDVITLNPINKHIQVFPSDQIQQLTIEY